jgi:hypothetical protein
MRSQRFRFELDALAEISVAVSVALLPAGHVGERTIGCGSLRAAGFNDSQRLATLAGARSRRPILAFGFGKKIRAPIRERQAPQATASVAKELGRNLLRAGRAIAIGSASLKVCVSILSESQAILRLAEARQGRVPQPVYVSLAGASRINDSLGHEFADNRRLPSVAKFFTSRVEGRSHDAGVGVVEYDPRPKWQN